jgi:copper chaperone
MRTISLKIDGMSCGHCVAHVRRALAAVEGVQVEQVDIGSASASWDPRCTDPERIAQAIEDAGYAVHGEVET